MDLENVKEAIAHANEDELAQILVEVCRRSESLGYGEFEQAVIGNAPAANKDSVFDNGLNTVHDILGQLL